MTRALLVGAALLCGMAAPLGAQVKADLVPGARVQFVWPESGSSKRVTASLVSVEREAFTFRLDGAGSAYRSAPAVQELRFEEVGVMRVSHGQSRGHSALRGALWGAYLGGAAGGIAGPLAALSMERTVGESSALLGVSGGLIGAGIGAVIGAIVAPERWKSYRFVTSR